MERVEGEREYAYQLKFARHSLSTHHLTTHTSTDLLATNMLQNRRRKTRHGHQAGTRGCTPAPRRFRFRLQPKAMTATRSEWVSLVLREGPRGVGSSGFV